MDIEQLAAELENLKNGFGEQQKQQRFNGFIDRFGTKFNNNTGIANLILAEMDRRGVDEASEAASEAVQGVLDRLREEATAVLEATQGASQQVSELMQKVDNIQQAIDTAAGGMGATPTSDMGGEAPMAGPDAIGAPPPPDMGGGGDMGAPPPPDMGAGAPPPSPEGAMGGGDMGAPPPDMPPGPDAMGAPPPPDMPPPTLSDERMKNIKSKFATYNKQRQTTLSDARAKNVWRPSKQLVNLIKGTIV